MPFNRKEFRHKWDKERREKNLKYVRAYKVQYGCKECGFNKHHAGLVLDHINQKNKDRNKRSNGRAINFNWSLERINKEIAKCQILCATCHNIRTFKEQHYNYRS